jgi:hypothetical protein
VTTLVQSIFLGILGVDRGMLGYTGLAVAKGLTLGGLGVWWLVDLGLLISGRLKPRDGSLWEPMF